MWVKLFSWLKYTSLNDVVPFTRFIPFKTPMRNEIFEASCVDSLNQFNIKNYKCVYKLVYIFLSIFF